MENDNMLDEGVVETVPKSSSVGSKPNLDPCNEQTYSLNEQDHEQDGDYSAETSGRDQVDNTKQPTDVVDSSTASSTVSRPGIPSCAPAPPIEIKLFVGRLPRTYLEEHIRPLFEQYGNVVEVAVIRDKQTGNHKGSAFVRMATLCQADYAIRNLNNIKVVDCNNGAMTVKYATGEIENLGLSNTSAMDPSCDQAKLFVGSLPKTASEEQVREYFSPYGTIDEVFIMKDTNGSHRGCAFVKFAYKEQAIYAVEKLNGKIQIPGAPRPLEVRFAAPKRPFGGDAPGMGVMGASVGMPGSGMPGSGMPGSGMSPVMNAAAVMNPYGAVGNAGSLSPYGISGGYNMAANTSHAMSNTSRSTIIVPNNSAPRQAGSWKEYFNNEGRPYYHNEITGQTQWDRPPEFDEQAVTNNPYMYKSGGGGVHCGGGGVVAMGGTAIHSPMAGGGMMGGAGYVNSATMGNEATGPAGSNIFIFHIPNEWNQQDLVNNFCGFGNILSGRIAQDRLTGRNRGFAFVSYDNPESAAAAVSNMNGFMACGKRLKVTIKKGEEPHGGNSQPFSSPNVVSPSVVGGVTVSNVGTPNMVQGSPAGGVAYNPSIQGMVSNSMPIGMQQGGVITSQQQPQQQPSANLQPLGSQMQPIQGSTSGFIQGGTNWSTTAATSGGQNFPATNNSNLQPVNIGGYTSYGTGHRYGPY